jgi:hypothetical protein
MNGSTNPPKFDGNVNIDQRTVNGHTEWYVKDIGTFHRVNAETTFIGPPTTSQFYNKIKAHEDKHLDQFNTGKYSGLWNANGLYSIRLYKMTSLVSKIDLEATISMAIDAEDSRCLDVKNKDTCTVIEPEAYAAGNSADPDFLELDEADWRPKYNCN